MIQLLAVMGRLFSRGRPSWRIALEALVIDFVVFWVLERLIEPTNPLVKAGNFDWYFFVSSTTMGYGDLYPVTTLGKQVAIVCLLISIASGTALIAAIIGILTTRRGKRMKGLLPVKATNHVVIFGYHAKDERTRKLIGFLRQQCGLPIAVAAPESVTAVNPLHDADVEFVSGSPLDAATYELARLGEADCCIIDADSDADSVFIALNLRHAYPNVRVIMTLDDIDSMTQVRIPGKAIEFVGKAPALVAEITGTPGSANWYAEIQSAGGDVNTETFILPPELDGITVGELVSRLAPNLPNFSISYVKPDCCAQVNGQQWLLVLRTGDLVGYLANRAVTNSQLASL